MMLIMKITHFTQSNTFSAGVKMSHFYLDSINLISMIASIQDLDTLSMLFCAMFHSISMKSCIEFPSIGLIMSKATDEKNDYITSSCLTNFYPIIIRMLFSNFRCRTAYKLRY